MILALIIAQILIIQLGPVVGPVIQADGRLTFEDELRSGGLLYLTTLDLACRQYGHTGEPGGD